MLFVGTSIIHPSTEGVFLLCNILDLLIYSKKVNWVKSCFATCDKDELFLGKNVLNARITQEQFVEEMKKIK